MPEFDGVRIVFDATSANAHRVNWNMLQNTGVRVLDLTPAALVPTVCRRSTLTSMSTNTT